MGSVVNLSCILWFKLTVYTPDLKSIVHHTPRCEVSAPWNLNVPCVSTEIFRQLNSYYDWLLGIQFIIYHLSPQHGASVQFICSYSSPLRPPGHKWNTPLLILLSKQLPVTQGKEGKKVFGNMGTKSLNPASVRPLWRWTFPCAPGDGKKSQLYLIC